MISYDFPMISYDFPMISNDLLIAFLINYGPWKSQQSSGCLHEPFREPFPGTIYGKHLSDVLFFLFFKFIHFEFVLSFNYFISMFG